MTEVRKLKLLNYLVIFLFSTIYIVCFTIPDSYRKQLWNNLNYNSEIFNNQNDPDNINYQDISDCLCSRKWMFPPTMDLDNRTRVVKTESDLKRLNSSCSDEGTFYQTNQNVISFSLFYPKKSSKSKYTSNLNFQLGLLQNLLMMRKHYPGYSIRVYNSVPLEPNGPFCELLCKNEDLFWCDISKTPSHGDLSWTDFRTWRFLTLGDPTVNVFHVRDLDSLISHREAAAAEDWLSNSNKAIIVMRDYKGAHNVPMLGGMWGADNSKLIGKADKLREQLIWKSKPANSKGKGKDQKYLNSVIFYPMAKNILAYDSYHCVKWSKLTEVRPFPVRKTNPATDFVGNYVRFSENGTEAKKWKVHKCPSKCRPPYGLDWIYC